MVPWVAPTNIHLLRVTIYDKTIKCRGFLAQFELRTKGLSLATMLLPIPREARSVPGLKVQVVASL